MLKLSAILSASAILAASALGEPHKVKDFDWTTVEPSTSLNYSTCYDDHKCAKLTVPLDWLDEGNEKRVVLAVIARPAVVDEDDESFGGTIIVNPGGPSGSGVDFVLRAGDVIQATADGNKKYEILSFDPRGVGLTTPNSDCLNNEFARGNAMVEDRAIGPVDGSKSAMTRKMARSVAFGNLCYADGEDADDVREFVSTSSVARDMVEIVDKLHEMRRGDGAGEDGQDEEDEDDVRMELRSEKKDDTPRIQYWGFSYGTVLGNYFASMFPGRVGRMILEAVEDPYDYANATWILNLKDTDAVYDHLWDTCYEARSKCALYKDGDKKPFDIRTRFESFADSLDESPFPYFTGETYLSITRADIMNVVFGPLYQPLVMFPELANTLAEAMDGNFTSVFTSLGLPKPADSCPALIPETYTWNQDAEMSIACGDGESQTDMTLAEYAEYVRTLTSDSPDFGASWSQIRLFCKGWRFRAKYRFTGPFATPEPDASLVKGRPAAPILFQSSRYDPVTPLANAIEASKHHPGSSVLIQDNCGHGSLRAPGKCREDYIKRYFETGEVPKDQTVCKQDCRPFLDCPRTDAFVAAAVSLDSSRSPLNYRPRLELF